MEKQDEAQTFSKVGAGWQKNTHFNEIIFVAVTI